MLSVDGLTCLRGGLPVIADVTFRLAAGSALILRGPNGSGKTTLLRTLAGLQPAAAGTISAPAEGIAYAGHADAVKATLTVAENLAFWAEVHGTGGIRPALEAFGLTSLAERQAQHLSAGQRRRLGLARLTLTGRPIWALDEPTVSLDTAAVELFAACARAHLAGGGIALVATHVDLGLEAAELDMTRFAARASLDGFDTAFA
jgi:heme exporter protein A